jgi:hypothetical protein
VAGVDTVLSRVLASGTSPYLFNQWVNISAYAFASGRTRAQITPQGSTTAAAVAESWSSALATGGALASGKSGIYNYNAGTPFMTTYYDTFSSQDVGFDQGGPPTGFTDDLSSIDHNAEWAGESSGAAYPLNGTSIIPSTYNPPASGYLSQDSIERTYVATGPTYLTPQVVISGNSTTYGYNATDPTNNDYDLFADALVGGVWQYNYIGAVLKRLNSSTWIEARYTSANNAAMNAAHATPAAPYTLELWSSHTAGGVAGVTRLGAWDVPVANIDGTRKRLSTYMDILGVVYVELWDNDPNFADSGLVARYSFTLPSPLAAVYGPTVAGRSGMSIKLARWDDGTGTGIDVETMMLNYAAPYIATYEGSDFETSAFILDCPVISDMDDIPVKLVLRGGLDSPSINFVNLDTGENAQMSFANVFSEADPVTIDMDAGTIFSASGVNYFNRRQSGSRFFSFSPGHNIIMVTANNWDTTAPAHVIASWRDVLK